MLELKCNAVVNIEPLYIAAGRYTASASSTRPKFINKIIFHIQEDLLVSCSMLTKSYILFENEEAVMKFFLTFDQEVFFNNYANFDDRQRKQAMEAISKKANELNW